MNKIEEPGVIIVIGQNRSGTKLLSSILCNSQDVIGMQRERENAGKHSGGMMETNIFGNLQRVFRSFSRPDDYIGFVELWSSTDFFKVTGINKDFLFTLNPRPADPIRLFRVVMNEVARRANCRFWLQKTSPFPAPLVISSFKDCKIVIIKRNIKDTIRSQLGAIRQEKRRENILREVYLYILQDKMLNRIAKKYEDVTSSQYEYLKERPDKEAERICNSIGIEFHQDMLQIPYGRNTSFLQEKKKDNGFV